jgi:cytoskeletal protein RodZ
VVWWATCSKLRSTEKHHTLNIIVKQAKNESAFYFVRRKRGTGARPRSDTRTHMHVSETNVSVVSPAARQNDSDSDSDASASESDSDHLKWDLVAETGLVLDAFLRSGESVHQSNHTSRNGNQLEITLTRLTNHTELLEAAKQNTVHVSLSSSRVNATSPRLSESSSSDHSPTPRAKGSCTPHALPLHRLTQTQLNWLFLQDAPFTRPRRVCCTAQAICPRARISLPSSLGRPLPVT